MVRLIRTISPPIALALFLCVLFPTQVAQAQDTRGAVTGTARDSTGAVLPGALIELQPSGKRAVADTQGQFRIADVVTGDYTLTATYVGFDAFSAPLKVVSDHPTLLDPTLQVAATDQITVTSERLRGAAEAINIQKTSDDIVQVLPAQVIRSLPNTNIADAVGRLPSVTLERDEGEGKYVQIRGTEPRLSNTTIDGVNVPSPEGSVRNIKLDVIPAALVERIEVSKTLSANQDGDAIGGSVNLVTRTPTERPSYEFGMQGGYTPIQDGRFLYDFDGTYGQRFGATHKLGFLFGATFDHNDRGIDDLESLPQVVQDANGNNVATFTTADLRTYKYHRTRYGFASTMDYSFRPTTSFYIKSLFSDFHDDGETHVYTPNVGALLTSGPTVANFDNTGSYQYREYIRRPDQQIFNILTGLSQTWNSSHLNLSVAGARSHNIGGQDFATTSFNGPTGVQFNVDTRDPLRPQFNVQNNINVFDPTLYSISSVVIPRAHATQVNFQGNADYTSFYRVANHSGSWQIGTAIRNAHKTQNQADENFNGNTDASGNLVTPTLSQGLSGEGNPNYYGGSYKYGPLSEYGKLQRLFQTNTASFTPDLITATRNSLGATYDATERIFAGYGMNTISFGKFRFQTGLRIEATDATYSAFNVIAPTVDGNGNPVPQMVVPVPGSSGYINFLPSVQVQYQIDQNTNLRASYGRGLSRPNFQDIVPSSQSDPNTKPSSIVKGNPALVDTTANNFDILAEHFFQGIGVVQAGFFYKALTNPIYNTTVTTGSGVNQVQIKQSINGPSAHITGVELAYQQRLKFLPGLLDGIGIDGNYSYTTSQVTFPAALNRTDHAALLRQAPNTYNLGMTYDKSRFSMRFGLSHNDANIYSYAYSQGDALANDPIVGLRGPNGDSYLYAHTQYDIQGSYRIVKNLRFVASGLNLSNEVFGFYSGSPQYPFQREFYKPTTSFGFRWNSSSGEDQ